MSTSVSQRRGPELGIALLAGAVLCLLVAVAAARIAGYQPPEPEAGAITASRELVFIDLGEGRVAVTDHASGHTLMTLAPGEGSFIRGVLRSMARERRSLELGSQLPFLLSQHEDGHLRIEDLGTGRVIDLQAFGPSNEGAFAALLPVSVAQR